MVKYQVEQMACVKGLRMAHQVAKLALEQLHFVKKMIGYLVAFEKLS